MAMPEVFIIMQIGEPGLDSICERAMVPALKACGFDPKRVDKHNQGGLLKSEIIGFIEEEFRGATHNSSRSSLK